MCCFSRPVRFVGGTRIFARALPDGRQWLAYSMNVEIDQDLAMVLPLPVPPGPADDAVSFLDLSGYPRFFLDLAKAFPPIMLMQAKSRGFRLAPEQPRLVVHDVGMFEASFVPTRRDFARLDERFRLPEDTFAKLPIYEDYGFAVFRLKPHRGWFGRIKRQTVHPMAFSFPTRAPGSLFFPTVHVHDGTLPPQAHFDHELYCQADGVLGASTGWTRSSEPLAKSLDVDRARGLVDGRQHALQTPLLGSLHNEDVWLHPPEGITEADLSGSGEGFAWTVQACWAQRIPSFGKPDARFEAWRETSSKRLGGVSRALAAGLPELVSRRREAWRLGPLDPSLRPHFINGTQLWGGEDYMNGTREIVPGPGRVRFKPFTDRVEPQIVDLGFRELPDQATVDEIHVELRRLLDLGA